MLILCRINILRSLSAALKSCCSNEVVVFKLIYELSHQSRKKALRCFIGSNLDIWRRREDSGLRYHFWRTAFRVRPIRPLWHASFP